MPTYEFKNTATGVVEEHVMRMSEKDQFLKDHPELESYFSSTPEMITGYHKKPDQGFRDVLRNIKEKNSRGFTRSTVNTF